MKQRLGLETHRPEVIFLVCLAIAAIGFNLWPHIRRMMQPPRQVSVHSWGANNFGQHGTGSSSFKSTDPAASVVDLDGVQQIALGLNHSLALVGDGTVYAWGSNQYGQLGQTSALKQRPLPVVVNGLPKISAIAAKQDHSVALAEDGSVWTWGLNMSGQLGDGSNTDRAAPTKVAGLAQPAVRITAGYRTTLAVLRDGSLWGWGGDCGLATSRSSAFLDTVKLLSTDGAYANPATATAKTGTYVNITPEEDCVNEDVVGIKSIRPKKIEGLPAVKEVSAGFGHMLALDNDNQLWAWGCNTYAQVGNGTVGRGEGANLRPEKVGGMADVAQISAGFRHSLVRKQDGSTWAWGHNFSGAVGNGRPDDMVVAPVRVEGLPKLRQAVAGHDYSMATDETGNLWGWGNGGTWQLTGATGFERRPRAAWRLGNVSQLAVGGGHVVAITSEDSIPEKDLQQ